MAKEMMIVFVYDTEYCQEEADDPANAVLYFHPSWVSETQKLALCGQLMGTAHFLNVTFGKPKAIGLQSGKFILKDFGRFLLAVGTDRNIEQSLLEHRADLLESFIKFFHNDIQTIYDQFSINCQYKNLKEKLYHIFETYLPILQYNGNVFQNMPISRLPKSASTIFLESMQTLQSCQQTKGILGGMILYHNKVIATQLCPTLTTNLVLTDPYRIKTTAEIIPVDFHVPVGCTLIAIYIPTKEYRKLSADAVHAQTAFNQASASFVPFQFKRKMKRDKSIIFSHIPEEGLPDVEFRQVPNRPTHLPLRFKNVASKELPESGFGSINFDENDSYPEFIGKTSVCSTPMTENKVLHAAVLSICVNPEEPAPQEPVAAKPNSFPEIDVTKNLTNFLTYSMKSSQEARRNSLNDIHKAFQRFSKHFSMKPFGLSNLTPKPDIVDGCYDEEDDMVDDVDSNERRVYRTITDPYYPVFNSDGAPISKCLFEEIYEANAIVDDVVDASDEAEFGIDAIALESKENEHPDHASEIILNKENEYPDHVSEIILNEEIKPKDVDVLPLETPSTSNRRSLSLPLKSLTQENGSGQTSSGSIFDSPARRKKMSGIQLTPLMSKLTILAMNDERTNDFPNWDTTPGAEAPTPSEVKMFKRKSSVKPEDILDVGGDLFQKVELFVCGQQNMTLMLVLEEGSAQKKELVHSMFETCVSRLTKIETNLNQSFNVNIDSSKNDGQYSFISLDPNWNTLQRGGPWSPSDLNLVENMRNDFAKNKQMTDLILRTDEAVLYGYQYGESNVFYKQTAQPHIGIPPPADVMGTAPLYAKRRLERDHSIILL